MLTWDVIVLNGYLAINVFIAGYLLWCRWCGREPVKKFYLPIVFLSIAWAVSIHTVTAFLYSGLGGRPFWNTALLAPRFLASAFVAGPAFIIVSLMLLQRVGGYPFGDRPIGFLVKLVRVTALINLFMLGAEMFTVFYTGSTHAAAMEYLMFGSHGKSAFGALVLDCGRDERGGCWLIPMAQTHAASQAYGRCLPSDLRRYLD